MNPLSHWKPKRVLTAGLLLIIPALSIFILAQDSQTRPGIHDVLIDRYGETVEWTVKGDVITYWNPVVVKGQTRAPSIPKPTSSQISTWIQEAIQAEVNAAALPEPVAVPSVTPPVPPVFIRDPQWRALIAAMCVMTECSDEDAAWAAFLAALP